MPRSDVFGVFGATVAATLLSGCGLFGGSSSYRFKMTVEVETPEGLKAGSSVYEARAKNEVALTPGGVGRTKSLKGEAVVVDLPNGQTLFALLRLANGTSSDDDLTQMSMAALDPNYKNDWIESAQRIASGDGIRSTAAIAPEDYPLLVTFADLSDPRSVVKVDPANLSASFGRNVRLKRLVVEVTNDAVTTGIEKRLQLQGIHEGHGLDRTRGATPVRTLPQRLGYTDFVRR